jgi:hypothetical protein
VVDKQPIIGGEIKTVFPYANSQLLCYCIICDGHLANGKHVAVIGDSKVAIANELHGLKPWDVEFDMPLKIVFNTSSSAHFV